MVSGLGGERQPISLKGFAEFKILLYFIVDSTIVSFIDCYYHLQ